MLIELILLTATILPFVTYMVAFTFTSGFTLGINLMVPKGDRLTSREMCIQSLLWPKFWFQVIRKLRNEGKVD